MGGFRRPADRSQARHHLGRGRSAAVTAIVLAATVGGGVAARAEGPGYGGTADELSVTWTEPAAVAMAAPFDNTPIVPGSDATANPDVIGTQDRGPLLAVSGVGFRSQSTVDVRVGDAATEERRTDVSGSLTMKVPSNISADLQPGASVLAIGTSPSGTRRTLVGSIPPRPSGIGPSDVLPWLGLLAFGTAGVVVVVRRRRGASAESSSAEPLRQQ